MRRAVLVFITGCIVFVNGCGVSESDYNKMVSERDSLQEKLSDAQEQIFTLEEGSRALHDENQTLMAQIDKLKLEQRRGRKKGKSKPSPKISKSRTKDRFYTVKRGDSLWKISVQTGLSVATLKKLNNIIGSQIKVGQKLNLTP